MIVASRSLLKAWLGRVDNVWLPSSGARTCVLVPGGTMSRVNAAVFATLAVIATGLGTGGLPAVAAVVGGPVSNISATWTPSLATSGTDGTVEQVRQMVQCGSTMYAVGRFTQIAQGNQVYTRNNAFSFSASTGVLTGWNPNVSGQVNSIALSADCSTAYLGGSFSAIGSTSAARIAAVSTATGAVNTAFAHSASNTVSTVVRTPGGHLLVGGNFTSANGSTAHSYLASLNLTSGLDDGYVALNISGNYVYTDAAGRQSTNNGTQVFNTSLSPDGKRLLAMGVFTSVGGQGRRQIFMLDLGDTKATVNAWNSSEFSANCAVSHPFWLRDAGWSPDGSNVFVATTGYKPASGPGYYTQEPRAGLCDAAAAFPSTAGYVTHTWVNYTGCDTLYSIAADSSAAYFGGHERWANNSLGCDAAGPGAVAAPGMVGLNPSSGAIVSNPTRGLGQGADDMMLTSTGLWISSDNAFGANTCGKTATGATSKGHAGICFLPY